MNDDRQGGETYQLDEFYIDLQNDGSNLKKLSEEILCAHPFPGLRPFKTSEHELFFGRSYQTNELLSRLENHHFLAVIGSSGTGKSSLIRAGLIPALFGGKIKSTGSNWKIAICRPGNNPISNLAIAMTNLATGSKDKNVLLAENAKIQPLLERSSYGILEVFKLLQTEASTLGRQNLFVIIDQFEELFRFDRKELKSTNPLYENIEYDFVRLLLQAASGLNPNIYVVLTMRSEFLGDCVRFKDLPEEINKSQYLVPSLTSAQLREIIEGPVLRVNKKISPDLTTVLINEIETEKLKENLDQLPIIQHALMRSFEKAFLSGTMSEEMNYEHYESIGGMKEALGKHAREIFRTMGEHVTVNFYPDNYDNKLIPITGVKQKISKMVFQALTDFSSGQKSGRRPTELKNIYAILSVLKASREEANKVINEFRQPNISFIMPPDTTPLDGTLMLDIAHESLMRNWPDLLAWMEEEAKAAELYKKLNERREQFERDPEAYIRGLLLKDLKTWQETGLYNSAWAFRYQKDNNTQSVKEGKDNAFDKNIAFLNRCEKKRLDEEAEKTEVIQKQRKQLEEEIERRKNVEKLKNEANEAGLIATEAAKKAKRNFKTALVVAGFAIICLALAIFFLDKSNKQQNKYQQLLSNNLLVLAGNEYSQKNHRLAFLLAKQSDSLSGKNYLGDSLLKTWSLLEYAGIPEQIRTSEDGSIVCIQKKDSVEIIHIMDTIERNNPVKKMLSKNFILSRDGTYIGIVQKAGQNNNEDSISVYEIIKNNLTLKRITIISVPAFVSNLFKLNSQKILLTNKDLIYYKNDSVIKKISLVNNLGDSIKIPRTVKGSFSGLNYFSSYKYYKDSLILWFAYDKYIKIKAGQGKYEFNKGFDYQQIYRQNSLEENGNLFLSKQEGVFYRIDSNSKQALFKLNIADLRLNYFGESENKYFYYIVEYYTKKGFLISKNDIRPGRLTTVKYIPFNNTKTVYNCGDNFMLQKKDSIVFIDNDAVYSRKISKFDSVPIYNAYLLYCPEISTIMVNEYRYNSGSESGFFQNGHIQIDQDSLVFYKDSIAGFDLNYHRLSFYKKQEGIFRLTTRKKIKAYWAEFFGELTPEERKYYGID